MTDDVTRYGPAMRALTERQQLFVLAMAANPFGTQLSWAKAAGYRVTPGAMRVTAHRLSHDPKVQAAVYEVAQANLRTFGPLLASVGLMRIARDPKHPKHMKALGAMANRVGLPESSPWRRWRRRPTSSSTAGRSGSSSLSEAAGVLRARRDEARAAADRRQPERQDPCRRVRGGAAPDRGISGPGGRGRFDRPTKGWIAGETSLAVRDIQQKKLCGEPGVDEAFGTGMIPKDAFTDKPSLARGVTDAFDTIQVRHKSGGVSVGRFKSYEQGRAKFQGETLDWLWFDEEPPEDVYSEGLTRTVATGGMAFMTFTPLKGGRRW
jgi:phage terminase large subunit-like protein